MCVKALPAQADGQATPYAPCVQHSYRSGQANTMCSTAKFEHNLCLDAQPGAQLVS